MGSYTEGVWPLRAIGRMLARHTDQTSEEEMMEPQSHTMEPQSHPENFGAQPADRSPRRGLLHRGWRKITWVLIAWSTLVVVGGLALAGHASNQYSSACQNSLGDGSLCQQVGNQAASDQFGHILKIGVVGFVILSIIWFMTRPRSA